MTTGTKVVDLRSPVYLNWQGITAPMGKDFLATWSGPDSPDPHARTHNSFDKTTQLRQDDVVDFLLYGISAQKASSAFVCTSGLTATTALSFSVLDDIALWNKLHRKVSGHQFNAGVALGEGNKSLAMVVGTWKRVSKAVRAVKRGRVTEALKHLGCRQVPGKDKYVRNKSGGSFSFTRPGPGFSPGSLWLEFQYGWKPLLSDIKSSADAFFALTNRSMQRTFRVSQTKTSTWLQGQPLARLQALKVNSRRKTRRLTVELSEAYTPQASLGLDDPLSIAWELVPFSFVVDWFAPVGNYLEARSFVNSIQGLVDLSTLSVDEALCPEITPPLISILNGSASWLPTNAKYHLRMQSFSRTKRYKVSEVKPSLFKFITAISPLDVNVTWSRSISALALASQQMRRP